MKWYSWRIYTNCRFFLLLSVSLRLSSLISRETVLHDPLLRGFPFLSSSSVQFERPNPKQQLRLLISKKIWQTTLNYRVCVRPALMFYNFVFSTQPLNAPAISFRCYVSVPSSIFAHGATPVDRRQLHIFRDFTPL